MEKKRKKIIFEKLRSFIEEGKMFRSSKSNLLWIERIIDFIDNVLHVLLVVALIWGFIIFCRYELILRCGG